MWNIFFTEISKIILLKFNFIFCIFKPKISIFPKTKYIGARRDENFHSIPYNYSISTDFWEKMLSFI